MVFLEKQRVEEIRVTEAMQKIEEDEQKRFVHLQKEEQRKRIESDKKLAQKMEKEKQEEEDRLALIEQKLLLLKTKELFIAPKSFSVDLNTTYLTTLEPDVSSPVLLGTKVSNSKDLYKKSSKKEIIPSLTKEEKLPILGVLQDTIPEDFDLEILDTISEENFERENNFFMQQVHKEDRELERKKKKNRSAIANFLGVKPLDKWVKGGIKYATTPYNLTNGVEGRETLSIPLSISPIKNFNIGINLKFDVSDYENIYYQPDFSYTFAYSDWRMDTWSLQYGNYSNNKFTPKEGEDRFNFKSGRWDLDYKTKIDSVKLQGSFQYKHEQDSRVFKITASKSLTLFDKRVKGSMQWKHYFHKKQERIKFIVKSKIYKRFMVKGTAFIYTNSEIQKDSEYDYGFSFGWYDPRPYRPTISYSNYYMPTKWHGRKGRTEVPFSAGVVSIKMSF